jgi:hypothetical protein
MKIGSWKTVIFPFQFSWLARKAAPTGWGKHTWKLLQYSNISLRANAQCVQDSPRVVGEFAVDANARWSVRALILSLQHAQQGGATTSRYRGCSARSIVAAAQRRRRRCQRALLIARVYLLLQIITSVAPFRHRHCRSCQHHRYHLHCPAPASRFGCLCVSAYAPSPHRIKLCDSCRQPQSYPLFTSCGNKSGGLNPASTRCLQLWCSTPVATVGRCSLVVAAAALTFCCSLEAVSFSWFSPALFPGCFLVSNAEHELVDSWSLWGSVNFSIALFDSNISHDRFAFLYVP